VPTIVKEQVAAPSPFWLKEEIPLSYRSFLFAASAVEAARNNYNKNLLLQIAFSNPGLDIVVPGRRSSSSTITTNNNNSTDFQQNRKREQPCLQQQEKAFSETAVAAKNGGHLEAPYLVSCGRAVTAKRKKGSIHSSSTSGSLRSSCMRVRQKKDDDNLIIQNEQWQHQHKDSNSSKDNNNKKEENVKEEELIISVCAMPSFIPEQLHSMRDLRGDHR